jgi:hypothetical protein
MISPDGIPNCGSCKHYSEGFCNANPTYLGRASECSQFDRVSTTVEIEETINRLGEWFKSTNKPPTQMIIGIGHPFFKKLIGEEQFSTPVSKDKILQ